MLRHTVYTVTGHPATGGEDPDPVIFYLPDPDPTPTSYVFIGNIAYFLSNIQEFLEISKYFRCLKLIYYISKK